MEVFAVKTSISGALLLCALGSVSMSLSAQEVQRGVAIVSEDIASQIQAFSYREGKESKLQFQGTPLVPRCEGWGEVEFQQGRSRISVGLKQLPEPWQLGPYTVYVLWALTMEGRATNLGTLTGTKELRPLETSVPLSQFAMIVTAEPHFAVTAPSKAVVARNLAQKIAGTTSVVRTVQERADYANLTPQKFDPKGKIPLALYQARYAVEIAKIVGAEEFAPVAFGRATQLLQSAEAAQVGKKSAQRKTVPQLARDTVQQAEDARREAVAGKLAAAEKAQREKEAKEAADKAATVAAALAAEEGRRRAKIAAEQAAEEERIMARRDLEDRLDSVLPTRITERGLVAEISGVQFTSGAATLNPQAREALARFVGIVLSYPTLQFMVEGHTDSQGKPETNQALSLSRAMSVRDYLISQGLRANKIDVEGMGPAAPVADNETPTGRARNRRVEIIMWGDEIGI
jgi:outer membrane protein OmpA-like peptidoglycan-associated protein